AGRYVGFLRAVIEGSDWHEEPAAPADTQPETVRGRLSACPTSWATDEPSRQYVETHSTRLEKTLAITPPGGPDDRILEMGAYLQITPALRSRLGYGEVRGCYYGELGRVDRRRV